MAEVRTDETDWQKEGDVNEKQTVGWDRQVDGQIQERTDEADKHTEGRTSGWTDTRKDR